MLLAHVSMRRVAGVGRGMRPAARATLSLAVAPREFMSPMQGLMSSSSPRHYATKTIQVETLGEQEKREQRERQQLIMKRLGKGAFYSLMGGCLAIYAYQYRYNQAYDADIKEKIKSATERRYIPAREANVTRLASGETFDVLVIGGGATGAGVAMDAATRGLTV